MTRLLSRILKQFASSRLRTRARAVSGLRGSDRSLREELLVGSLAGLHAANWRRIDQLPSPSIELIVRQCLAMNSVRMMMPTVMLAICAKRISQSVRFLISCAFIASLHIL
jgi:hypothetical protein